MKKVTRISLRSLLLALCALVLVVLPAMLAPSTFSQQADLTFLIRQSSIGATARAPTETQTLAALSDRASLALVRRLVFAQRLLLAVDFPLTPPSRKARLSPARSNPPGIALVDNQV